MELNKNYKPLVNAYAKYLQTLGFASTTVYNYPHFITHFLMYLQQLNINHIKLITEATIKTYYTYLENTTGNRTNKAFSTSHLNTQFLAIDKFLEFLHQHGLQSAPMPTKYTVDHYAQKQIIVLTTEQVQILYNTVPFLYTEYVLKIREPRQACARLVLDLCYGCGLRRFEALNLKISDVNFDTKTIHIKQGKNYKDRLVPMSDGVYKSIQTFVYQYRTHFVNKRTGYVYPYSSENIKQILNLLIKQCNNTSIQQNPPSPHSLRHSIATHLLNKGMSIDNIARFLGHSTLQSTQRYAHVNTK
jgi:integrase/recombinase XerD